MALSGNKFQPAPPSVHEVAACSFDPSRLAIVQRSVCRMVEILVGQPFRQILHPVRFFEKNKLVARKLLKTR
jgi:hypothetical protein